VTPFVWPRMRILTGWAAMAVCLLFLGTLSACSDLKKAHGLLNDARTSAVAAQKNVDKAVSLLAEPEPRVEEAVGHLSQAHSDLNTTIDSLDGINESLSGLQDIPNPWPAVLWMLGLFGVLAIVAYLWGPVIRPWMVALGMLAPRPEKASLAAIAKDVLDPGKPDATSRELVAAMRTSDPELNAAFVAEKEKNDAR
jgi:hypothetical protein